MEKLFGKVRKTTLFLLKSKNQKYHFFSHFYEKASNFNKKGRHSGGNLRTETEKPLKTI
jgi:hypothetical protein